MPNKPLNRMIKHLIPVIAIITILGCADQASDIYLKSSVVDSLKQTLVDSCGDNWCEPYAEQATKSCVEKHFNFTTLRNLTGKDRENYADSAIWEAQVCALQESHRLHNEFMKDA